MFTGQDNWLLEKNTMKSKKKSKGIHHVQGESYIMGQVGTGIDHGILKKYVGRKSKDNHSP